MKVEFTVTGGDGLIARLQQMPTNIDNGLRAAGIFLLADAQRTIKQGGSGWADFRKPPKRSHALLYDTGRLVGSLSPNGDGNVFEENGNSVTVGSNLAYAAALNYGYPKRNLPPRQYLYIDDDRAKKMIAILSKYLFSEPGSTA